MTSSSYLRAALAGLAALAGSPPLGASLAPTGAPQAGGRELVLLVEEAHLSAWQELEGLAREFEAEHPGLRVRRLPLGGAAGAQDKAKFLLAGDLQLDLLRIDITELAGYLAENALADLEPFFAADPGWRPEDYFPVALDALRDRSGHLVGLPSTFTPYVMYVNLDRLDQLGRTRPAPDWTWSDFLELARAATADSDGDGRTDRYGISLTQWLQALSPWVWQAGGDWLDPGGTHAVMDQPAGRRALEFLHGLLHEERVASFDASFANQLTQGLFQGGAALFYGPVGYWETYRFKNLRDFRWDVLPLPRDVRAATAVAMTVYVVPRTAREPELAYEFLRLLAGPRYQRMLARIGNGVPGLIAAARSPDFLKPDVAPESESVFLEVMEQARFLPPLANWRQIESLCAAELDSILLDPDCDVAAATRRMAERTDEYLARERARGALPRFPGWVLALALSLALLALLAGFLLRRGPRPALLALREERAASVLLLPWAAGFLLFLLGPALVSLALSLGEWSPLRALDDVRWVGAANYQRLTVDPTFHTSLRATTLYALGSVPLGLVLALGLALLLRSESTLASVVRTACYLPAILAPVIVGAIWRFLLDAERGPVNDLLRRLGTEGPAWLRDSSSVVPAFVLVSLWSVGAQMLVFLAALQALDPSLEEAARIDGAGAVRRLWHVTLPQLAPVLLFNALTGTVAAFQLFAQPYVMTQGGPGDASRFLVLYLYESAFLHLDMGYASAIAWVLFALLAGVCALFLRVSRPWVHYRGSSRA